MIPTENADANRRTDRHANELAALGIVLLAWLAFAPSLGNDFALDDNLARVANGGARIHSIGRTCVRGSKDRGRHQSLPSRRTGFATNFHELIQF